MYIQVGSTVEICGNVPYKEYNVEKGDIGVVSYVASTGNYAVSIPGKKNPHSDACNSKYGEPGYFWIPAKNLKLYEFKEGDQVRIVAGSRYNGKLARIVGAKYDNVYVLVNEEKDTSMLMATDVRLIRNEREDNKMEKLTGYKNIAVIEINDKDYFYVLYEEDYKPGDQVLVSGNMNQKFYTIKEVLTIEDFKEKYKRQLEGTELKFTHEVISKVDTSAYDLRIANRAKAAELRKEMDKKIAEIDEMRKYTLYAEKCPELAAMLEEYNSLV